MEMPIVWRSVPRPCRKVIVTAIKTQRMVWNFRPFRKTSLPILKFVRKNPKVEKFIQTEITGTFVTSILGDDPTLYMQYGMTFNQMAIRMLFHTIIRDMYITRFVESVIHLQHALGVEKFVHDVLPMFLTVLNVLKG